MDSLQLKMCDIQGRLFELSRKACYDSGPFISAFMRSKLAKSLDSVYNRMQWSGEEYLLEELESEVPNLPVTGAMYEKEMLFWIGYLYRYWHYLTGESSKEIYRQANENTMKRNYMMFHTLEPEIAVQDLKEIHRQKVINNA